MAIKPVGKLLALWREAGEWWVGEPYREVARYLDPKGILRHVERAFPSVGRLRGSRHACAEENNREEWSLRIHKRRDEKVAKACGRLPEETLLTAKQAERLEAAKQAAELAPYGTARKEIGRARRLMNLRKPRDSRLAIDDDTDTAKCTDGEAKFGRKPRAHDPLPTDVLQRPSGVARSSRATPYAPLHLYSGYAFGRGTMLAEEIPLLCASVGIPAAALVDPFSLAGCVEHVKRSKGAGIKPLVGASVQLPDGCWLVLIAKSKVGYQSLSELISACHLEEPRRFPMCTWERLERFSRDLICLTGGDLGPLNRLITKGRLDEARVVLDRLIGLYGKGDVFIEIERSFLPWEISVNNALLELAERMALTPVAGGLVTHARREHFPAQDVLVCAETLCVVDEILGRKPPRDPSQPQIAPRPERALNAERFLRTPEEMGALFRGTSETPGLSDRSDLLKNTLLVADRCDDDVLPGRTRLPQIFPDPNHALREIVFAGAFLRHKQIAPRLKQRLDYELDRIARLNFADYFLAIWDACRWAEDQGIQLSGRGSVVDSAVAYCLGLSRIDAFKHNLHFDRFLPADGSKRPDIDVDFEARRRDDVRKYFSDKYGAERVAGIAAIGAYCTRGIIREVGKVFGLPSDVIGFLAKKVHGGIPPDQLESALDKRPELASSGIPKERFRWVFEMAELLMDVPRNMRAHSSGLILSDRPIRETAPLMWSASPFARERIPGDERADDAWPMAIGGDEKLPTANCLPLTPLFPIIQWDKRSAKHFFDKFDILCLRGQDVLSGTQERIRLSEGERRLSDFNVQRIPLDDEETYRAMRSGELIGIPQSASPAMRQAHIRLRTRNLDDASLVQAGIRPGVGGAVKINELIARRRGKPYSFEHPELEKVLGNTYGIIVFQEQVDQLLQVFCGYSSGEAEEIREAIHERRREDYGEQLRREIIGRVLANGYAQAVAERVYDYVSGFKGYGFAQGHALAFADISIRSIWCQQNFPAEYFASLLTAQPAGYYGPCTLANEARLRGARILPPDVNRSNETFSVEDVKSDMDPKIVLPNAGIRVGLMQITGLSKDTMRRIVSLRSSLAGRSSPATQVTDCDSRWGDSPSGILASRSSERLEEPCTTDRSSRRSDRPSRGVDRGRFSSFGDFVARVRPERDELENLILCGALDSLHSNRRAMLWAIPRAAEYAELRWEIERSRSCGSSDARHTKDAHPPSEPAKRVPPAADRHRPSQASHRQSHSINPCLPLSVAEPEMPSEVEDFTDAEKAVFERGLLNLDVERHLMAFERERVASRGGITCAEAKRLHPGKKAIVVGNPIRLRFPPTPSGKRVVFFDLEDETGLLNVTCFDAVYQRDGHAIVCSPYVTIIGVAQDRDGHIAFLAQRVFPYEPKLLSLAKAPSSLPLTTADFLAQ